MPWKILFKRPQLHKQALKIYGLTQLLSAYLCWITPAVS